MDAATDLAGGRGDPVVIAASTLVLNAVAALNAVLASSRGLRGAAHPTFADLLLHELRHGLTGWAIGTWLVVTAASRLGPAASRPRLRLPGMVLAIHTALVIGGAALEAARYVATPIQVASFALVLLALIGTVQALVFWIVLPRLGIRVPRILVDVVTAVAAVGALIAVGNRVGFSLAGLITTSAVLTAVIGFSMQDTLGNLMGGLALQMDSSITVGDWISLGPGLASGRVTEIRWRYTAIETRSWETVIVPNSVLMKGTVTVLGRRLGAPPLLRRHLEFHVDFRTLPTVVIAAVLNELRSSPVPGMSLEPPPQVLFYAVRESYAVYAVRFWLRDLAIDDPTDSDVRIRIYFALQRAGIPLAIPSQSRIVTNDDDERRDRKNREEHERRLAAVAGVDLFHALESDERAGLANQLRYAPFAAGEAVTREGDSDDGLYIILRGEASVRIRTEEEERELARLGSGSFFGEMSLMTGEARAATVVAASDLECYRLDKPVFEALLRRRPTLADAVAEVLATRRAALDAARERAGGDTPSHAATKHDLVSRIRRFFALGEAD